MAWWRKDVNWGIYAQGKAWGEFLWGLAGGKIAIEGALISPPFTIYVAGELTLTLCYVEVFDGRAWIALGEKGFDGGTGGDNKYDKLISDARNIGKQMKKDMEKLAEDLKKAREALYKLSDQQRIAAGKALMKLSAWSGGKDIGAFFGKAYKDWYKHDLYGRKYPYENILNSDKADPILAQVFNKIWNPKAAAFLQLEMTLKSDSAAIAKAISEIETKESELKTLLHSHGDLLNEKLPTLSDLGKLKSPVTKPVLTSSTINGKSIVVFDYNFSPTDANNLKSNVFKGKTELDAYRKKLLSMVADYVKKLNEIKSILAGGSSSVSGISKEYAATYDKVSRYTTRFMDFLNGRQNWAASEAGKMLDLEKKIDTGLDSQANKLTVSSDKFKKLCQQRIDLINGLLQIGAAKNINPPKNNITSTNYKDMGMELYYHIPQKGFSSVDNEMGKARQTFVKYFKASNDIYHAKWNNFTVQCDKVYSRQAKLYTILYDLFDQLSLEAGTRKLEGKSSQTLLVNTGDNLINQGNRMAFVNQTGSVSISSNAAQYAAGGMAFGSSQIGQTSFQQVIQSGAINTSTGDNVSQSAYKGKLTKKGEWAKGWDFEKERKTVKKILQVPKIVQLTGKAISDKSTNGYSKLTLNWKGEHPIGIAEYSFSIEGYSDPVNLSDITSGTSGNQLLIAEFIGDESADQMMVSDYSAGALTQLTGDNLSGDINSADISLDGQLGTSATYNANFSVAGETLKAWRTVGNKQNLVIPFLNQVHDEGNYNVWIRARGAGGYTLERLSSINIDYCGSASKTADFDASKRESSLSTTDNTPPTTPSVYDGGDTTSSLNQIMAKWSSTDYESGIHEFQYQVGYYSGSQFNTVTPWLSAGGQTEMNIRLDQQFIPGKVYYVKVKAVNGVKKWSKEGVSNGIQLKDPTPPNKPRISIITLSDSLLSATWSTASDPETGIIGYLFSLGSSSGSSDIINWCAVQSTDLNLSKVQLSKILKASLQKETAYYFSVKAMNGIGIVGAVNTKSVLMK